MKKQKRMKQITAILLIVILLAIIGSTIYFAVSGSQLFWMSLFLMFFFPIFLWAMSFLYKWSKNKNEHWCFIFSAHFYFTFWFFPNILWYFSHIHFPLVHKTLFQEAHLEDTVVLHNDLDNHAHIYIRFHVLVSLQCH